MPTKTALHATETGHAHDVSVETTFDFLNTLDHDDGFPREKLPTSLGPLLVRRTRPHSPRRRRQGARAGCLSSRASRPAISSGSGPSGRHSARSPTRSSSTARLARTRSRPSIRRCTPARSSSSPVARRRQCRPPPCRGPDRRRTRATVRGDGHRADQRPSRPVPCLRQRHVPVDLLRHLADGQTPLVRHGDMWQPGQGGAPPRQDVAQDLRSASRPAPGPA